MKIRRDDYTDFSFNDIHSSSMKVYITNNRDIAMKLTPNFSDSFIAPAFAQQRYLTGTTIDKNDIQVKCIAVDVTLADWKAIQTWLSPLAKGKLSFDFNRFSYYNAKVASQISGTTFIEGHFDDILGDVHIIEFTVSFTTTDDWAALGPAVVGLANYRFEEPKTDAYYYSPESVINSRFYMPAIYCDSLEHNASNENSIDSKTGLQKTYITQPTIVLNKVLYVDMKKLKALSAASTYYFVDSNLTTGSNSVIIKNIGGENNSTYLHPVAKLFVGVDKDNKTTARILGELDNAYELTNTIDEGPLINDDIGFAFYGMNLMAIGTGDNMNDSPLYYYEDTNAYSIMNTGAYDMYPDISINSGTYSVIKVKKDDELIYDYELNFQNSTLDILGKYGMVLYTNAIAESAVVTTGSNSTEVVKEATNNGMLTIPNGNPELLKIVPIKSVESSIVVKNETKDENDKPIIVDIPIAVKKVTMLFFATYDKLKFSRNGKIATHIFSKSTPDQTPYDASFYPVDKTGIVLNTSTYGSSVTDSILSTNGMIFKVRIEDDEDTENKIVKAYSKMDCYCLILPTDDLKGVNFMNSKYISICDVTKLSIINDGAAEGFVTLQTRDAF